MILMVTFDDVNQAIIETRQKMEEVGFRPEIAEAVNFAMGVFVAAITRLAKHEGTTQ